MSLAIITHEKCLRHDIPGHPEQPDRLRVINEAIRRAQLNVKYYKAPRATKEALFQAHDQQYIERIFHSSPEKGYFTLDPDTMMNSETLTAALHAAGAVIYAVDLVMAQEVKAAFCNIRPPGHHAERNQAMGFCFFNNVAVGVTHALETYGLKRVAIIDFDVHHGNGTENIFQNDERVLLCSSFQHPFYPYSGADTINSHILNTPLPMGTSGKEYAQKVLSIWAPRVLDFKPEIIFFSAGFDGHKLDLLANLNLETEDYGMITRTFKAIADECAQGRIVSTLEGGYALEILGDSVLAHLRALE